MKSLAKDTQAEPDSKTLAALIGLILVTALTVGLLVSTIGFLQSETAGTDDASTQELEITAETAAVNDPGHPDVDVSDDLGDDGDPVVYEHRLELQRSQDSGDVDLTALELDYASGDGSTGTLTHVSEALDDGDLEPDGDAGGVAVAENVYFVEPVAVETNDEILSDDGDRYELVIPTGVFVDDSGELFMGPRDDERVAAPENNYDDGDVATSPVSALDSGEGYDNSGLGLVEGGEEITITVTTATGAQQTTEFQVPGSLADDAGDTVTL